MEVKDLVYMPTNVAGLLVALGVCENLRQAYQLCEDHRIGINYEGQDWDTATKTWKPKLCTWEADCASNKPCFITNVEHSLLVDGKCVAQFRM